MHPAPIKINNKRDLPHLAVYQMTLDSGELIYSAPNGQIYAVQPKEN